MAKTLHELLVESTDLFQPVIPFNEKNDVLMALDLTAANHSLTSGIFSNTGLFTKWVEQQLSHNNARYAIGGYNEHRTVYAMSSLFDNENGMEPRRLHLGTDIWGSVNTPIAAPINGKVHSFAFNNNHGDYGTTIILEHQIRERIFYTLYGHLTLDSLASVYAGKLLEAGEVFTAIGNADDNGGWPPHLHFQVIDDIGEWRGDYPGVAPYSQRQSWLANSPDPDPILKLNRFLR